MELIREKNKKEAKRIWLNGAAAPSVLAILGAGLVAMPAAAQDVPAATPQATPDAAPPPADGQSTGQDIVVTGSIFRGANTSTPSPVTSITSETFDQRGFTSVSDALRSISADSAGSISSAFANGFAGGSTAVSLRGLSVNSTLVLFDGLRAANYPLADDGERAFVDLNTIPEAIIDRVDVLKDGASSTYGSDAIAGVVNVIIKKQIVGVSGRAEGGITERGDGGHQRLSFTAGYGDLKTNGWNAYISAEYQRDDIVHTRDRGFPYNTKDLTSIGGLNGNPGAKAPGGSGSNATTVAVVAPGMESRPGDILSGVPIPGALYQPIAGTCGNLITHTTAAGKFCEENIAGNYATLSPLITRYGATGHLTVNVGGNSQAYATLTYYRSRTRNDLIPNQLNGNNPTDFTNVVLPALLPNGQLNPNDPFAAQGYGALISYRFADVPYQRIYDNQSWRGAIGISGSLGDGWNYSVDATAMTSTLDYIQTGWANIAALKSAIINGTYNFVNPSLNSQAVRDAIFPVIHTKPKTELYLGQASITKEVITLPGGPLEFGIGGSVRHEKTDDKSQNPNGETLGLNNFSAVGQRTVVSGYFEVNAPILTNLQVNGGGRFDHYSEGFNNFSPKIGAKFSPIPQLSLRGTYSQGFRAPSIPEVSGSVVGYAGNAPPPADVIAAHHNDAYVQPYRIGLNTAGTPGLKPEKSRSFTAGIILQPDRRISLTVDYYNIRKTDVITAGPLIPQARAAYYAGQPLPAGYTVDLNAADPLYPDAIKTIKFVNGPYVNSASFQTSGIDVQLQGRFKLSPTVRFITALEVTEIFESNLTDGGVTQRYVGTEGPYNVSASVGTPRWKGNWQNTLEVGPLSLTATAYYVSGYKETSADNIDDGSSAMDCKNDLYTVAKFCNVNSFIDVDLVVNYQVNDKFSFYVNVVNALGAHAPINPANYGVGASGANYNSAYAQDGVIGRAFRAGARFKF